MKKTLLIGFLSAFGLLFSQQTDRKYNLIVAFDTSLDISRESSKDNLITQIQGLEDLVNQYDFDLRYSFCFTEEKLQKMEEDALRISGKSESIQNLRNVFDVVNHDLTDEDLQDLSEDLQVLPKVKYVELIDAKPVKPPFDIAPITPNYTSQQTYINANPGVDMQYAWDMNLNAQGIRIRDVEYGFNKNHEEFHQNPAVFLAPGYTVHWSMTTDYTEHGTGTLGVIFGDNGNYGVTGMAYGAEEVILYPEYTTQYGYNRNFATSLALDNSLQGDVVIYEMQTGGANSTEESPNFVPAEYSLSIWNLTQAASDLGIIVVAAAGNGGQNLDAVEYTQYMARGNSGAIIVGAGSPSTVHNRMSFSTYGSRVNLQGWGQNVLSSGYGDFAVIGGDFNQQYTMFSGTSSATPIVASCVAVLQSYYHSLTGEYLNAAEMIDILQLTGIPQGGNTTQNIGPLPNVQAAIAYVQTLTRNDITEKPSFTVYPNPFDNELNINGFRNSENTSYVLFNAIGQKVLEGSFSNQTVISTENLQAGVYFLKVADGRKIITHKVVKK